MPKYETHIFFRQESNYKALRLDSPGKGSRSSSREVAATNAASAASASRSGSASASQA